MLWLELLEAFEEEGTNLRGTRDYRRGGEGDVTPYCEIGSGDEILLRSDPRRNYVCGDDDEAKAEEGGEGKFGGLRLDSMLR